MGDTNYFCRLYSAMRRIKNSVWELTRRCDVNVNTLYTSLSATDPVFVDPKPARVSPHFWSMFCCSVAGPSKAGGGETDLMVTVTHTWGL